MSAAVPTPRRVTVIVGTRIRQWESYSAGAQAGASPFSPREPGSIPAHLSPTAYRHGYADARARQTGRA